MQKKTMRFVLPAVAAGLLLAGCASGDQGRPAAAPGSASASPAPGEHNQADVAFTQQMIPHHQQAVETAKLVPTRTTNQQVLDLAKQIQQAQDPEIQKMTGWLRTWAVPAPIAGMDHGSMPGMMSADAMIRLGQASAAGFDRMWLQMMINHHQGAVEMARTELRQGSSADAKQLAQQIIDAQQKEIATMNGLLGQG